MRCAVSHRAFVIRPLQLMNDEHFSHVRGAPLTTRGPACAHHGGENSLCGAFAWYMAVILRFVLRVQNGSASGTTSSTPSASAAWLVNASASGSSPFPSTFVSRVGLKHRCHSHPVGAKCTRRLFNTRYYTDTALSITAESLLSLRRAMRGGKAATSWASRRTVCT